ncbi:MAG: hypothetical protein V2A58_10875 [Planctomycetota bacterium]
MAFSTMRNWWQRMEWGTGPRRGEPVGGVPLRYFAWVVLALFLLLFFARCHEAVTSPLVIQNDERAHNMPYLSFHHKGVLEGSLIRDYMLAYEPIGHRALYYLMTFFLSPFVASKVVWIGLYGVVVLYCVKLGRLGGYPEAGAMLGLLFLGSPMCEALAGGLPRSFALPVVLAFLYYLLAGNDLGALVTLVVGAGFYPPAFAVCFAGYGLSVLADAARLERSETVRRMWRLGLVAIVCLLVLLPSVVKPDFVGHVVSLEKARSMPEFGPKGRWAGHLPFERLDRILVRQIPVAFRAVGRPLNEGILAFSEAFHPVPLFWVVVSVTSLLAAGAGGAVGRMGLFGAASAVVYVAAQCLGYRLFHPSRMVIFAWPVLVGTMCCLGIARLPVWRGKPGMVDFRLLGVFALLLSRMVAYGTGADLTVRDLGCIDCRDRAGLYEFFRGTRKDALIAGDPYELDNVMSFSARKAYVTYESAHSLYDRYYAEIKRRFEALHRGYFATDPKDLLEFVSSEGIDYLLVNREHFEYGGALYQLFEPIDSALRERLEGVGEGSFVLSRDLSGAVVFRSGLFLVIDCRRLKGALEEEKGE